MHGSDTEPQTSHGLSSDSSPDGGGAIAPSPPGTLLPEPTIIGESDPPPPSRPSRLGVLRHHHYRTIFIAAFGSYLGSWFEFVAIRWIVSQQTKSEAWMGYLAAAQLGPTLILGMFGGLVADSVNRKTLIVVTQVCMMLIALAMAAAVHFGFATPPVLLALMLAHGIAVAFNMPAWQVLTPRLVPRDELSKAITLNGISFNAARVIGPATGGLIMKAFQTAAPVAVAGSALFAADALSTPGGIDGGAIVEVGRGVSRGASALLFFNAITFIGVLMAVLSTPDAPAPADLRGAWKKPGIAWARTREALSWTWSHKGPRAVLIAVVIFAVLATPIMQLMPLMVSEVYGRQEDTFGTLLALMGCGAVAGGFAMKLIPKWYPMHHFIPLSILGAGITILAFSLTNSPRLGIPLMFVIGVFWMWGFNSCAVAIQHLVAEEMRGRVSAVVNSIALGLMPVGTWVASALGHGAEHGLKSVRPEWVHHGSATQLGLASVSAALVVAAVVMLIWRTPEVDGIEPGQPGYDKKPGLWRGITASAHRPRE